MRPMKCISCREEIRLAHVNRHLNKDRILLLCRTCAGITMSDANWDMVKGSSRKVQCLGCDKPVNVLLINQALPSAMGFCIACQKKLVRLSLWEECRRVGDDGFLYTPDTITTN